MHLEQASTVSGWQAGVSAVFDPDPNAHVASSPTPPPRASRRGGGLGIVAAALMLGAVAGGAAGAAVGGHLAPGPAAIPTPATLLQTAYKAAGAATAGTAAVAATTPTSGGPTTVSQVT